MSEIRKKQKTETDLSEENDMTGLVIWDIDDTMVVIRGAVKYAESNDEELQRRWSRLAEDYLNKYMDEQLFFDSAEHHPVVEKLSHWTTMKNKSLLSCPPVDIPTDITKASRKITRNRIAYTSYLCARYDAAQRGENIFVESLSTVSTSLTNERNSLKKEKYCHNQVCVQPQNDSDNTSLLLRSVERDAILDAIEISGTSMVPITATSTDDGVGGPHAHEDDNVLRDGIGKGPEDNVLQSLVHDHSTCLHGSSVARAVTPDFVSDLLCGSRNVDGNITDDGNLPGADKSLPGFAATLVNQVSEERDCGREGGCDGVAVRAIPDGIRSSISAPSEQEGGRMQTPLEEFHQGWQCTFNEMEARTYNWSQRTKAVLKHLKEKGCRNVIVTSSEIVPALAKLMMWGYAEFFDIDHIYSSVKRSKAAVFAQVMEDVVDEGYVPAFVAACGDGRDEERAAIMYGVPFRHIEVPEDLYHVPSLLHERLAMAIPVIKSSSPALCFRGSAVPSRRASYSSLAGSVFTSRGGSLLGSSSPSRRSSFIGAEVLRVNGDNCGEEDDDSFLVGGSYTTTARTDSSDQTEEPYTLAAAVVAALNAVAEEFGGEEGEEEEEAKESAHDKRRAHVVDDTNKKDDGFVAASTTTVAADDDRRDVLPNSSGPPSQCSSAGGAAAVRFAVPHLSALSLRSVELSALALADSTETTDREIVQSPRVSLDPYSMYLAEQSRKIEYCTSCMQAIGNPSRKEKKDY